VFSANPILFFSPARLVRIIQLNLHQREATKEVVINVVNFDLVQQHPLQAQSMPINEFDEPDLRQSFRFSEAIQSKESPVQFECKVNQIIPLELKAGEILVR
jgi:flavin reductase (DIM6/NTAB) family NADH-FMN oxidoreductase RutF